MLIDDPGIRGLANLCFDESLRVARWTGHLGPDELRFADVETVARATAANHSSMLQDIERGKRTEIDQITGEIVRIRIAGRARCPNEQHPGALGLRPLQ